MGGPGGPGGPRPSFGPRDSGGGGGYRGGPPPAYVAPPPDFGGEGFDNRRPSKRGTGSRRGLRRRKRGFD